MTKGPETYSIAEAAELLGVSKRTIRRRIHRGELPAKLEEGPYGPEYRIPSEAINTAQQIIDVVKVERSTDPMTLALVISQVLDARDRGLQEEIVQLRHQVEALTRALESYQQREEERDRWLVAELRRALEEPKGQGGQTKGKQRWWQRLFKR